VQIDDETFFWHEHFMSDDLPGYTCPDIDEVRRIIRRLGRSARFSMGREAADREQVAALDLLERIRKANTKLRSRCGELLRERKK